MIGREDDDQPETENGRSGGGAAHCCQVQSSHAKDDRRPERDDREHAGQRADRHRVRKAGEEVGNSHQHALGQADEDQAVHGSEHCLSHAQPDPLPAGAEQPVAEKQELAVEGRTVAEQKKQRQKSEPEQDQPVDHLCAVLTGGFGQRAGADASKQLLSGAGVAQICPPPILDRVAESGYLRDPIRHRDAVALGLD